jgi:hypothetical protein
MKTISLFSAFLIVSLIISFCGIAFADDTFPPMPNPPTWAIVPHVYSDGIYYYHTMTATTATDVSPPVYYYFDCLSGVSPDSGWLTSPTYTTRPFLSENYSIYCFYTKDSLGNVSAPSSAYDIYGYNQDVPEPATICLFAIAGFMLRRKK